MEFEGCIAGHVNDSDIDIHITLCQEDIYMMPNRWNGRASTKLHAPNTVLALACSAVYRLYITTQMHA